METKSERQKQLEAILGHELDAAAIQRLPLSQAPIATYAILDDIQAGRPVTSYVTWEHLVYPFPKRCDPGTPILDVCSYAQTGDDGKTVLRLSQVVCLQGTYMAINVVATPRSPDPCFLTVEYFVVDQATDVEIKVSTWKANGAAAPYVEFDWRCRAVFWRPF